jgi:hypothetical protein
LLVGQSRASLKKMVVVGDRNPPQRPPNTTIGKKADFMGEKYLKLCRKIAQSGRPGTGVDGQSR